MTVRADEIHNILIIKPGAIGDLLQITPAIRALKARYPHARISLLVSARSTASLFGNNPHVHETIVFDKRGEHRTLSALCTLWRRLRSARYDLVINFQRSNLKAWFLVTAALPCRVLVYHKARGRVVHAVVNHLETIAPLGIAAVNLKLELYPAADDEAYAEELWRSGGWHAAPVVALNPGASNRIKCWDTRRFAELGDRLRTELGARVVIVGGPEERDLAEAIRAAMQTEPEDLIGRTSLTQLGAVLKRCAVLVSGDTGPLHLATAVDTPVVALFGAIDPRRTGPVGDGHVVIRHPEIPCVPCMARTCKNPVHLECMEKITVAEVFEAVREVLSRKGGARCAC